MITTIDSPNHPPCLELPGNIRQLVPLLTFARGIRSLFGFPTRPLGGSVRCYDMRSVSIDTPHHPVVMAAQALAAHPEVDGLLVVSGRDETARRATEAWLTFHGIPFDRLFLRRTGDRRADNIVKGEIYDAFIAPHYEVVGVVDDRRSVVTMWRSRGLVCFQVAEGDF